MEQILFAAIETPSLNDTVDTISKNGIETVLSAVVIITILTGLSIFAWWLKRKLSGDYIKKSDALAYVRKNHPDVIKPTVTELADLRDHDAFDMWDRELRYCDSLQVVNPDGTINLVQSAIAKDIIQWNIRAHRNTFKKILDESYNLVKKDPSTFEEYFGDSKGFNHKINNAYTQIKAGVAYKLKGDLKMPEIVFDSFDQYRAEVHETMRDMLQIAVTNHTNNYWRLHEVLNAQYAFTRTFRISVMNFLSCSGDKFNEVEYVSKNNQETLIGIESGLKYDSTRTSSNIFDYT